MVLTNQSTLELIHELKVQQIELAKANEQLQKEVTECKKAEQALIQSEKLKSLGTITAGISHEFNNILNIISGHVQLLQMGYKDHSKLMDSLSIIRRSVDDGAEISKKMLEFTQAKKNTTGFVCSDINEILKQAIEFTMPRWKNMAQAKGTNYNMDTEGMKRVPSILCNPTELREVFVNIINNALDAMPDGGSLSFRTWSKGDTVFVSITDTGEGMTVDVKKNIFDPFFTTRCPEGTGLGMSTSYSKMVRHGGKIEVDSKEGKGSTFTLQFPATTETVSPKVSPEPKQEIKRNNLRILVVDDEKNICNILDKFLSGSGHKVKTVDNGADAINIIKAEDIDLVLCDLAMPNVYGYDVVRTLNELEKRPKIGIMTGWGEKLKPIDDEDFKVDFIIKKPFDFSELSKQINELFS
jgi:signal transduction histidine kinase